MSAYRKYADNSVQNSVSNKFRRKRFELFKSLIAELPKPLRILDVGGTVNFWKQMGFEDPSIAEITLLNNSPENVNSTNFEFIAGDARNLGMFKDKEFDIVFSNSVIEHVGGINDQKKMADEIIRTGKSYFIQTPNYFFPFEPHFLFPCFQFLPRSFRKFLLQKFRLGWFDKAKSPLEADAILDSINLLTHKDLKILFPESLLKREKFFFLTKSFIIVPR